MPGVVGDLLKVLGTVVAASSEDRHVLIGEMLVDAVAVKLDFVDLAIAARYLVDIRRQGRGDEARKPRFGPDRGRLFPLKRHNATPQQTNDLNRAALAIVPPARSAKKEAPILARVGRASTGRRPRMAKKAKKASARGRRQDRARVAGGQDYEVRYETKKTGQSAASVKKAVKKVGNSRKRVERRLNSGAKKGAR